MPILIIWRMNLRISIRHMRKHKRNWRNLGIKILILSNRIRIFWLDMLVAKVVKLMRYLKITLSSSIPNMTRWRLCSWENPRVFTSLDREESTWRSRREIISKYVSEVVLSPLMISLNSLLRLRRQRSREGTWFPASRTSSQCKNSDFGRAVNHMSRVRLDLVKLLEMACTPGLPLDSTMFLLDCSTMSIPLLVGCLLLNCHPQDLHPSCLTQDSSGKEKPIDDLNSLV